MAIVKYLINLRLPALLKVMKSTDSGVKFKKIGKHYSSHIFSETKQHVSFNDNANKKLAYYLYKKSLLSLTCSFIVVNLRYGLF